MSEPPSRLPGSSSGSTVAVIGLGLMGGSLVRALISREDGTRVLGATPDPRDRAAAERVLRVPAAPDARDVIADADLVVYAAPLAPIVEMVPVHAPLLRDDAVVTDVAGLKRPILHAVQRAGLSSRYVGAHPMAGGERSGFDGGHEDLFRDALVWLCADRGVEPHAAQTVELFWSNLGCRPEWTDPESHDRLMERVSQLPQLTANALALALEDCGAQASDLGPGGRDMTRLAESSPEVWRDLFAHTAPELAGLLRDLGGRLEELAVRLESGELGAVAELMARTGRWRVGRGKRASETE